MGSEYAVLVCRGKGEISVLLLFTETIVWKPITIEYSIEYKIKNYFKRKLRKSLWEKWKINADIWVKKIKRLLLLQHNGEKNYLIFFFQSWEKSAH